MECVEVCEDDALRSITQTEDLIPTYSPSFIIGQDADNGWDVVSKGDFRDTIGIDNSLNVSGAQSKWTQIVEEVTPHNRDGTEGLY